jgi:cohesin complex subunit SCC1
MLIQRSASPLSELPVTPLPEENLSAPAPAAEDDTAAKSNKRPQKEKKQIIDAVTELKDGPGAKVGRGRNAGLGAPMTKDVSNIITEQHFLPKSSIVMRLREIREDPLAHFLPTKVTPNGTFFCGAPPGMAPVLAELFLRPVNNVLASKRRGASPDKGANKKPRLDQVDDEVELPRRQGSVAPSVMGSDIVGRRSLGPEGGFDFGDQTAGIEDFQMDLGGDLDMGADAGRLDLDRTRSKSAAPTDRSRVSTPAADGGLPLDEEETYADTTCQIATFDIRPLTQTQDAEKEPEPIENEGKGYSKNTVKALSIIRKELQPVADEEDQDKSLSFRKISDKVCQISFIFHQTCRLFITCRPPDVPRLRSSLNCSCWVHETASNSRKPQHSKTSRCAPRTNYGNVSAMAPWHHHALVLSLLLSNRPLG